MVLKPVLLQFHIFWSDYLKMPQLILTSCQHLEESHTLANQAWSFIIQGLDKRMIQHETERLKDFDMCLSSQDSLAHSK